MQSVVQVLAASKQVVAGARTRPCGQCGLLTLGNYSFVFALTAAVRQVMVPLRGVVRCTGV